jgi:hypothetical protein
MAPLSTHTASQITKLLLIGDSGAGKTGALASLADAGYNLRIIDTDAGLDVLTNLLTDPKSPYRKDSISRVSFKTITETMKNVNGKLLPARATVWQRVSKALDHWRDDAAEGAPAEDFGPITTWGPRDVLVLDSLSTIATGAMNWVMSLNGRLGGRAEQGDWYQAQQAVETLMQMLYDSGVGCNVIVQCHVAWIGDEANPERGYPASLGKALSPRLGRYFNTILLAQTTGQGPATKRRIITQSTGRIELKNTAPLRVPRDYPLETGLADYFRDLRGGATPGAGGAAHK